MPCIGLNPIHMQCKSLISSVPLYLISVHIPRYPVYPCISSSIALYHLHPFKSLISFYIRGLKRGSSFDVKQGSYSNLRQHGNMVSAEQYGTPTEAPYGDVSFDMTRVRLQGSKTYLKTSRVVANKRT